MVMYVDREVGAVARLDKATLPTDFLTAFRKKVEDETPPEILTIAQEEVQKTGVFERAKRYIEEGTLQRFEGFTLSALGALAEEMDTSGDTYQFSKEDVSNKITDIEGGIIRERLKVGLRDGIVVAAVANIYPHILVSLGTLVAHNGNILKALPALTAANVMLFAVDTPGWIPGILGRGPYAAVKTFKNYLERKSQGLEGVDNSFKLLASMSVLPVVGNFVIPLFVLNDPMLNKAFEVFIKKLKREGNIKAALKRMKKDEDHSLTLANS